MPNIRTTISVILLISSLSACSSQPRQVTASIPLVASIQEKPNKKEIPAQYWAALSDTTKNQLQHNKYQVHLGALYTSALGSLCRELTIIDDMAKVEKRVACLTSFINKQNEKEKAWFLEKEIIESTGYVEL